mmetsp:Transcript_36487/g.109631  ORF Transcript_36487/g.109631 Transcript_36487/m.109631 type:complete len:208 (+) Transcript_36487:128-751(+)
MSQQRRERHRPRLPRSRWPDARLLLLRGSQVPKVRSVPPGQDGRVGGEIPVPQRPPPPLGDGPRKRCPPQGGAGHAFGPGIARGHPPLLVDDPIRPVMVSCALPLDVEAVPGEPVVRRPAVGGAFPLPPRRRGGAGRVRAGSSRNREDRGRVAGGVLRRRRRGRPARSLASVRAPPRGCHGRVHRRRGGAVPRLLLLRGAPGTHEGP